MGKGMEVSPQELKWCQLRARGFSQTEAYEEAFPNESRDRKSATEAASRLSKRPQVRSMLKQLFVEAKKSALLSHCEHLDIVLSDWRAARKAGAWTAAASFARIAGQCIGTLSETFNIQDQRLSREQILDRLAGDDPTLAAMLRRKLDAKKSFDA